ncbi:TPA: lanthionine synthetase, partial [Staphylococcus aureus]|nr:lanthionine synthetase [Staphylococcus aureus]
IEQIKDPGLFNGLSGLTYILAISSKNGRYDNLIEGTLPYLEYQTYDKISECIRNKNNKTVNDYDYDLISGLSGILKCYLNKHVIKYIQDKKVIDDIAICLADYFNFKEYNNLQISSSVLEYKMTKCTSKWTTFFILTYIPNYIQNDL